MTIWWPFVPSRQARVVGMPDSCTRAHKALPIYPGSGHRKSLLGRRVMSALRVGSNES
jgi:hypothetical protein